MLGRAVLLVAAATTLLFAIVDADHASTVLVLFDFFQIKTLITITSAVIYSIL
jgi:hypothetical protein